jgi:hypothetical protein
MKSPFPAWLSPSNTVLSLCLWSCLFSLILIPSSVSSVELTFELPDNAKDCFYENIEKGKQSTFEFQVRVKAIIMLYVICYVVPNTVGLVSFTEQISILLFSFTYPSFFMLFKLPGCHWWAVWRWRQYRGSQQTNHLQRNQEAVRHFHLDPGRRGRLFILFFQWIFNIFT